MSAKALIAAARDSKHVTGLPWGHTSAAFVASMSFRSVMLMLPKLRIYKPKKNRGDS